MIEEVEQMRLIGRARFVLALLPFLLGVACDPQGPGAMGQLNVSPEADIEAGRTLEIRAFPDDSKPFDPATANSARRAATSPRSRARTPVSATV